MLIGYVRHFKMNFYRISLFHGSDIRLRKDVSSDNREIGYDVDSAGRDNAGKPSSAGDSVSHNVIEPAPICLIGSPSIS